MTYEEARAFIDDTAKYGYVLGLDTERELLRRLGNPQDDLKFVHVAGTNGKGSTLAYVSTILKEAGYRVGRYISPTIFDYRERIQVNEEYISGEAVVRRADSVEAAGEPMLPEGRIIRRCLKWRRPWHFCGLWKSSVIWWCWSGDGRYYRRDQCGEDYGDGGIAVIGMDHMGVLGNTVGEIAAVRRELLSRDVAVSAAEPSRRSEWCCRRPVRKRRVDVVRFEDPISQMEDTYL